MASQRITVAKLAGLTGDIALQRLSRWSSARKTNDPNCWSPEQWPDHMRREANDFADRLRAHGFALPVCHFVEWSDLWSMGDLFPRWLTPPNCPAPIAVHTSRFEIFAYGLPDEGRLVSYLAAAGPQQFPEAEWYVTRLHEAALAWEKLVPRATLVVLRYVVNGLALDEEVALSLSSTAPWLL